MARKASTSLASVLAHKTASVGVQRNGLTIDVQGVPAEDVGLVAKELLDVLRTLVAAGYDELVVDGGSLHGGALGEAVDEEDDGEWVEPAHATARPPIGFGR